MEKRIRIIWALSLVSAFLLIGVQGYWLYNQYQHVVSAYAQELADKTRGAGEKEYKLRKNNTRNAHFYYVNKNIDSEVNRIDEKSSVRRISVTVSDMKGDEQSPDHEEAVKETISLHLLIHANDSEENMHVGVDRAIANFKNPFRAEILDSILSADMSGIGYIMTPMEVKDSVLLSSWQLAGNFFSPRIDVVYAYSPFEGKGVALQVPLPSQPLFGRMAVQLMLSLGLMLLLIGCLVLQVKTILKQKKINEIREEFVNTMIHELKRPVQTLKTFFSFLANKEMRSDETMTEQVVQDSMFELDNLSAYLQKLKDMICADNDAMSLHMSRFNLQELIGKITRLANHPVGKEIKISVCYEMESVEIEADRVHVANVVNNLIENAIKYSDEQVDIEIKAQLKRKELRLTVSDNGIGIAGSEQEKVFAKFYRGNNLPDKDIPGIGLGLSYVKLIAEAHKGSVSLFSDIGKGTSITVCLPQ